jgi:hypothetical protein
MIKKTRVVTTAAVQALWFYFLSHVGLGDSYADTGACTGLLKGRAPLWRAPLSASLLAAAVFFLRHRSSPMACCFFGTTVCCQAGNWALIVGLASAGRLDPRVSCHTYIGWGHLHSVGAKPVGDGSLWQRRCSCLLATRLRIPVAGALVASGVSTGLGTGRATEPFDLLWRWPAWYPGRRVVGSVTAPQTAPHGCWPYGRVSSLLVVCLKRRLPAMLLVVGIVVLLAGRRRFWQLVLSGVLLGGLGVASTFIPAVASCLAGGAVPCSGRPVAEVIGHTLAGCCGGAPGASRHGLCATTGCSISSCSSPATAAPISTVPITRWPTGDIQKKAKYRWISLPNWRPIARGKY